MQRQGPDFLCVGMPKAGTGWFYDALCLVDGFAMSPIKEFRHFDNTLGDGHSLGSGNRDVAHRVDSLNKQFERRRDALSWRAQRRLRRALDAYVADGFSNAAYLELFDRKRTGLTGDITPAYSGLDRDDVGRVFQVLPEMPVLLFVRHPVDRLWSSFNMNMRQWGKRDGLVGRKQLQANLEKEGSVEALEWYLGLPGILSKSRPAATFDAWSPRGCWAVKSCFRRIFRCRTKKPILPRFR